MTILIAIVVLYQLWILYVFTMHVKKVLPNLGPVAKAMAWPAVIVGVLLDWVVNMALTLAFWDPPGEWKELTTGRLKRYHEPSTAAWRTAVAEWMCDHVLDPFDPEGDHC